MAFEQMGLATRSYERILRVARTIADLDGAQSIATNHLAEAIQYRTYDSASRAAEPASNGKLYFGFSGTIHI